MKILMIIVLLGICSAAPAKKEKILPAKGAASSYQMPAAGLIIQI